LSTASEIPVKLLICKRTPVSAGCSGAAGSGAHDDGTCREHSVQPVDQGIELGGGQPIEPFQIGDDAMSNLSVVGAIAFDELEVAAPAGSGDLGIHATILFDY